MFCTVDLTHGLLRVLAFLLDVLSPLEPIQKIIAERFVKVEGDSCYDLTEKSCCASARSAGR
jgi:hypothetical protein